MLAAPGLRAALCAGALLVGGCGQVASAPDAAPTHDAPADAAEVPDAPPALGSQARPAKDCAELRDMVGPNSGVYWVRNPDGVNPAFDVYCEQVLNGGGWAMVLNSVRSPEGHTTEFWQLEYAVRFNRIGTAAPDQNYYNGFLYQVGTTYMDVFVDLDAKAAVAAVMTTTGIDRTTMKFGNPMLMLGDAGVFNNQFAAGWAAKDYDGDPSDGNCASSFANVAQHYGGCWVYNLGADADQPVLDGGVGPHVYNPVLAGLGLAAQPGGGSYSQVKRIARFTRW